MKAFPTEDVGIELARVVTMLDPMGYFIDGDSHDVVVVLPRDRDGADLPLEVTGYRLRHKISQFSSGEAAAAQQAVTSMPRGEERFGVSYDPRMDVIQVTGYFPDEAFLTRLRSIPGVLVTSLPDDQVLDRRRRRQR